MRHRAGLMLERQSQARAGGGIVGDDGQRLTAVSEMAINSLLC